MSLKRCPSGAREILSRFVRHFLERVIWDLSREIPLSEVFDKCRIIAHIGVQKWSLRLPLGGNQLICVQHTNDFHGFSWIVDSRFLQDHLELDHKLGIRDYLRLELVLFLIPREFIRLAAERHGWRQMLPNKTLENQEILYSPIWPRPLR